MGYGKPLDGSHLGSGVRFPSNGSVRYAQSSTSKVNTQSQVVGVGTVPSDWAFFGLEGVLLAGGGPLEAFKGFVVDADGVGEVDLGLAGLVWHLGCLVAGEGDGVVEDVGGGLAKGEDFAVAF